MKPTRFVLIDVKMEMISGTYTFACPIWLYECLEKGDLVGVKTRYGFTVGKFLNVNNSKHVKRVKYQWVVTKLSMLPELEKNLGAIDFNSREFTN